MDDNKYILYEFLQAPLNMWKLTYESLKKIPYGALVLYIMNFYVYTDFKNSSHKIKANFIWLLILIYFLPKIKNATKKLI